MLVYQRVTLKQYWIWPNLYRYTIPKTIPKNIEQLQITPSIDIFPPKQKVYIPYGSSRTFLGSGTGV